MKYLSQALLVFLFTCLGELLHYLIPAPIPASIYGMILLFAALGLKIVPSKAVSDVGGFLVSILPVLFVAPLVNLLDHWFAIKDALIPIFFIILASTILVFAVSGWVTQWLIRRKGGNEDA